MENRVLRRDFLKTAPVAAGMLAKAVRASGAQASSSSSRVRLEAFDFHGVRLRASQFQGQYQAARDFYFGVSNDDILQGLLAAPGERVSGKPGSGVFGQWLSGMSRMYRATGDIPMRDKAVYLMSEWAKTVGPDGDCRMRHYAYEKLVCGLVDLQVYADQKEAMAILERVTAWASKALKENPVPAIPGAQGAENLGSGRRASIIRFPRISIAPIRSREIPCSRHSPTAGCISLSGTSSPRQRLQPMFTDVMRTAT